MLTIAGAANAYTIYALITTLKISQVFTIYSFNPHVNPMD